MILFDAIISFFACVGIIATVYIIAIPFCRQDLTIALILKKKESVWVKFIRALFGDVLIFNGDEYGRGANKN